MEGVAENTWITGGLPVASLRLYTEANEKDMRKRGVPTIKEQLDDIQKTLKDQVEKDRQASEQVRQKQGLIPGLWQAIRSDKAISSIRLLWSKFPMAGIRILMYGLA